MAKVAWHTGHRGWRGVALGIAVVIGGCGSALIGVGGELRSAGRGCALLAEPGSEAPGDPFVLPDDYALETDPVRIVGPDGDVIAVEGSVISAGGLRRDESTADSSCPGTGESTIVIRRDLRVLED